MENVYKKIGNKEIIQDVSFTLNENEIVALVGPNGAGKTTLLKLISNLIHADTGNIEICNVNVGVNRLEALTMMSFMQDSSVLYDELTGYDHIIFISKMKKIGSEEVKQLIEKLKMKKYIHFKVKTYSLGMKQHLLLALSLLSKPKLLLMDEPLNGLDPSSSQLLREITLDLRKQGTTILFSSHILSEVDKVADRLLFIQEGKIISEEKNEISGNVTYTFKVSNPISAGKLLNQEKNVKVTTILKNGDLQITLLSPDLSKIIKLLIENSHSITDIVKTESNAELIYHNLYGDKK
ncbi:ABC transporter ATP-binding protein [Cytobacillus firmus]|uniref:ABC transporter ATP-binding protein n=1 Tax=Cytobacillus firmus TaxID=1399 RepID=UPI0030030943